MSAAAGAFVALRRAARRHRRLLAAGLTAAAVAAGLDAVAPTPAPSAEIVVASHDLPSGIALRAGDVTAVALPGAAVPDGALRVTEDAVGRLLAAPVRRGEPLTDVRLVGAPLVAATGPGGGLVAAPVRIADPGSVALLRPGDRVDVLATPTSGTGDTLTVASRVLVVTVPQPDSTAAPLNDDGALVVLATTQSTAAALAHAAVATRLSVTLHGDP